MSLNRDKKQLVIDLDAKEAINRIGYLRQEINKLNEERKKTNSYTSEKQLGEQVDKLTEQMKAAREEVGLHGLSLTELGRVRRELQRDLNKYPDESEQWKKINTEYEKVSARYKDVATKANFRAEQERNLRNEMLETVKTYGIEALSIQELDTLQKQLYRDIYSGSKSGEVANSQLLESYKEITAAVTATKQQLNRYTIAQEQEEKATIDAVKANKIQGSSITELKNYHAILTNQIRNSAEFESDLNKQRIREAQEVAAEIEGRESQIKGGGGMFEFLKSSMPAALAGGIAGAAVGIVDNLMGTIQEKFVQSIEFMKKRARDISEIETILNVDRGTAQNVFSDLNKINTERSRDELKELVLVAGDLNVATNDVQAFVTEADKLEKVFGRDFGNLGEASTMVAKLKDSFAETKGLEISEAYRQIGSSIKVLNDEGPASTKGMTEFIARIGQLPNAVKPAIADTAALAAVMEEANITAEISSGGISAVLLKAGKNAEEFATFFKMGKEEFQQFVATKPIDFLTKFAEKVGNYDEAKLAELFAGLKIESQESIKAISVLSDNLDKFRNKQSIANKAFLEGNRIDEIFTVFNEDENAQITKAEKKLLVFTERVSGAFGKLGTSLMVNFAKLLPDTITETEKLTNAFKSQTQKTENLEKNANRLLTRYNELISKTNRNATESTELKKVLNEIAEFMPDAITQWDKYGNAIAVSTTAINGNIIASRQKMREEKAAMDIQIAEDARAVKAEIERKQRSIDIFIKDKEDFDAGKKNRQAYPGSEKRIVQLRAGIKELKDDLLAQKRAARNATRDFPELAGFIPKTNDVVEPNPSPGTSNNNSNNKPDPFEQLNADKDKLAAFIFEKNQLLLEGQAKEEAALLNAKILQDEAIERDIKNTSEKRTALEVNKEIYDLELKALQDKYKKQQELEVSEQAKIAVALAQEKNKSDAQRELQLAEQAKDEVAIHNAKIRIISIDKANAIAKEETDFITQKTALGSNSEAIESLTKNHKQRLLGIEFDYNAKYNDLLAAGVLAATQAAKKRNEAELKAAVDKAQNNLDETKGSLIGGPAFEERLALIDAQKLLELSNTELTEQQKTEIVRKYSLQRASIEKERMQLIAKEAISVLSAAYTSISNGQKANIQAEAEANDTKQQKILDALEKQKEAGIISDAQYQAAKKSSEISYNKEVRRLRYEQAKLDKQNNIVQAITNGIQAVMKTFSTLGVPLGIPFAAVMGGISAYNIAQIAKQKLPEYYEGGSTGSTFGNMDSLGGRLSITHPNEYIVPSRITQTPQWAAIEPILESIRTGNNSGNTSTTSTGNSDIALAMVSNTLDKVEQRLQNLSIAFTANDWENFHRGYTDYNKQNSASLINK